MLNRKSEKGQAIIMIVFSVIGIIGLIALTVDGGMAYADRRHAQGAADSGAWAAGLANARGENIQDAAFEIANQNGYVNDGVNNTVDVTVTSLPIAPEPLADGSANPCPDGASPNVEINVTITSYVKTFFAPVIGVERVTNKVSAVTRACGTYIAPIFGGQAIVSLNPGPDCAFDSGSSNAAKWIVKGGGIFSNGCAISKNADSVTLDSGQCVSTVNNAASGFNPASICPGHAAGYTMADVNAITPPNPCTGTITGGVYAGGGKVVTVGQTTFTDGVYCMDTEAKMNALSQQDVVLKNATLYVTATQFDVKFAGGGGFSGTPTTTGEYSSYYMIVPNNSTTVPCTTFTGNGNNKQVLEYRGNGSGSLYGTVLAPSACVDFRGNGTGDVNSQLIGYTVTSNGNSDVKIDYVADQNRREPEQPTIELVK